MNPIRPFPSLSALYPPDHKESTNLSPTTTLTSPPPLSPTAGVRSPTSPPIPPSEPMRSPLRPPISPPFGMLGTHKLLHRHLRSNIDANWEPASHRLRPTEVLEALSELTINVSGIIPGTSLAKKCYQECIPSLEVAKKSDHPFSKQAQGTLERIVFKLKRAHPGCDSPK